MKKEMPGMRHFLDFTGSRFRSSIFTIVFLLLSCAANAEVDFFASWFEDQTKETGAEKVAISVEGTLPSYIKGNLIRLGPTINHTPTMNYSNFLDGFGRVTKWEIDSESNMIAYQSNLIHSNQYNESIGGGDLKIVRHITQEPTQPKMKMGTFKIENMDNTDVSLYQIQGEDSSFVTVTDLAKANVVDLNTLATLGPMPYDDDCKECKDAVFSGSHNGEWIDPETNDTYYVNWLGKKSRGKFTIYIYMMHPRTHKRKIVGSITLDWQPYSIHSIAVTGDYATLVLGHVELDFMETGESLCISCSTYDKLHEEPALVHVFNLAGDKLSSKIGPEISFEIPAEEAFFVFHYVNAFIDNNNSQLSIDMCAYDATDGFLGEHVLGDMHNIMSPSIRDNMPYNCDALRRMTIDLTAKKLSGIRELTTVDKQGFHYRLELVSINPKYWGRPACWGYGFTMHTNDSPQYSSMGIAKINLCAEGTDVGTVEVYHHDDVYVGEPLFVPDPAQPDTEDAGSLLVVSKDGTTGDTVLLVLNAQTMKVEATATAPFPTMFEFHGKFIPFPAK